MQANTQNRRIWIGRSLIAIAVVHTLFAVILFGSVFDDILQRGVFNAVNRDPLRSAAVWFLLFGGPLALAGMCINSLEKQAHFPLAKPLGWGILLICILGAVLMPVSGFWLAMPPALALLALRADSIPIGAKA